MGCAVGQVFFDDCKAGAVIAGGATIIDDQTRLYPMINDFIYFKLDNYIPSYICDEILKNHTQFDDATVEGDDGDDILKSSARKSEKI